MVCLGSFSLLPILLSLGCPEYQDIIGTRKRTHGQNFPQHQDRKDAELSAADCIRIMNAKR